MTKKPASDKSRQQLLDEIESLKKRLKRQKQFEAERKMLKEAEEMANIGHWVLDPDSQDVSGSDELFRIFGLNKDEGNLKMFLQMVHPDDRETDQNLIKRGFEFGEDWELKHRLLMPDGQIKWIHAIGKAITNRQGKTVRLLGTVQDITAWHLAETALKESEEKYRLLFDSIADPLLIFDQESKYFLDCNQAAINRYGYSKEEFKRMTPFELHPKEDLEKVDRNIDDKENISPNVYTHLTKDGEHVAVEIHTQEIVYQERPAWLSIIRDITVRQQSEQMLRESEKKYRDLVDNAPVGVYRSTLDGELLLANQALLDMFGFKTTAEARAVGITNLYKKPEDRKTFLGKLKEDRKITNFETELLHKSGESITILMSSYLDENYLSGMVVDISDIKKMELEKGLLEEELRQAQKMEAIGTLAGGIAHDFNNILGAILGYTELSLGLLPGESAVKHNMDQVLSAGHRARDLVQQILAFSRKSEREKKPLRVDLIVREALKLLRSTLPSTIVIKRMIPKSTPHIMANPTQIHQVLMNLCTNAAHAIGEKNGNIEIKLKEIELLEPEIREKNLPPGRFLQLMISDTGHGMKPDVTNRIFEPYYTTKNGGRGTGLGLSVVHGIVKSHGGEITVYSEPGIGTSFKVYFPIISKGDETQKGIRYDEDFIRGDERILLVDDEPALVQMGKQLLELLGYTVISFSDSRDALAAFTASPSDFDLLITDQTMPHLTGVQLLRKIRKLKAGFPVILCSGFSESISEKNYLDKGINAYVMKPFQLKALSHAVRRVLDEPNN